MSKIPYHAKSSKDILIDELRAQNQQLKHKVEKFEKTELTLYIMLLQAGVQEYKTSDGPPFGTALTLVERVGILIKKFENQS